MKQDQSICKPEVFESIFRTNSKTLRNYLYYKFGDEELANDMVQEAFIRLWNNCQKVLYNHVLFFLKRVASNLYLNEIKHKKVVLSYQQKTKINITEGKTPEDLFDEQQYMKKFQDCVASLSSKQREVFLLNRIDKKTYKEISELLGISVKAVEKRMHNALQTLKNKLLIKK